MHFKCLNVLILNIIASQNSSFISLLRYLLLRTKTQYKGRTIYYSFITIIIDACGHSVTRRSKHLTVKANVTTPPPSSVWDTIIANNTVQNRLVRFWMAFARLRYLSTNCTLTFGSSHCTTVDFFPNEISEIPAEGEKRRTRQFESKVKAIHGTFPCCDVCVYFRMSLFFVKYAHWPLTYFSPHRPRKGHRD